MNDKKNREPMVIALATGKGGSMKTTSAVFLACALVDQSRGEQHVLVADADVQGDAKDWWYRAAELDDPLPFDVMSAAPADIAHLHGINGRLDDPVDWVLIDSAPYGRALDESVNNADLVVIPSSPSRIDLDQAAGVKAHRGQHDRPPRRPSLDRRRGHRVLRDADPETPGHPQREIHPPPRVPPARIPRPVRRTQADHATAQGGGPVRNMNLTPRPRDLTALLTGGRPAPADTGRPESAETEIPKNRKTVKPNDAEGWVKTSVSLRASTRRRLKTFAAEHDMRIQEVIDAALETYLGFGGER